jgi:hypothetical protein
MAKQRVLTGVPELDSAMQQLAIPIANRIGKAALRAGVKAVAKAQKAAAPVGKTGGVQASIGSRMDAYGRQGLINAKAGVGVGKTTKTRTAVDAPHAHLVAAGTKKRWRKRIGGKYAWIKNPTNRQLSTGAVTPQDFIRRGYAAASSTLQSDMLAAARKQMVKETAKLAAKRAKQ